MKKEGLYFLVTFLFMGLSVNAQNTVTACESYTWNDIVYTTSGVYNGLSAGFTQLGIDIDGEAAEDRSGRSVSLSADGKRVAVGAFYNDGNGMNSGHVRIFEYDGVIWTQLGVDIDGQATSDRDGWSVSLSADGSRVAIGAPNNCGNGFYSGHVRLFEYDGANWVQLGSDIEGEEPYDRNGWSVSLSADGNKVALAASGYDSNTGYVRIFEYDGTNWQKLGANIEGEALSDWSGWSLSLSDDGNRIAIGAPFNDVNGESSGHVRLYEYVGTNWLQMGEDIIGLAPDDYTGYSVSLNDEGSIVAIGVPGDVNNGIDVGYVRLFEYIDKYWVQLGDDINGEAVGDHSGFSVSISDNGQRVAIGARYNNGNGNDSGHVRLYEYDDDGMNWLQLGDDIDGETVGDWSGASVSFSADGTRIAIGASGNDGNNGVLSGHVRVFELGDTMTTINLIIVDNPVATIVESGAGLLVDEADTYLWNTGDLTQAIIPASNGMYWCVITDENGCVSDTAYYDYQSFDLIETEEFIRIYPNPTKDNLSLESSLKIHAIQITDVSGRFINLAWKESHKVDVSEFAAGLYFMELQTDNGLVRKQFVKE